jgi:hypothetical protein
VRPIHAEYLANLIGIAKQSCADVAERVAAQNRVPPGAVERVLNALRRIADPKRGGDAAAF